MKKEPSIELIDNLLIQGTKYLKEECGGFKSFALKNYVNNELQKLGYNKINN
tara:strand:+ start:16126 stop:16281 length:156 start_codon:yes stop_codon:yes gene_type:complete